MMWNTTTILEDDFPGFMFNIFININYFVWEISITYWKIHINGCTCFVELGNPKAHPYLVGSDTMCRTCIKNALLNVLAKRLNLRPWAWSLKTFSDHTRVKAEISNISNHICQLVTLKPIFATTRKASIFCSNCKHFFLLSVTNILITFKEACCCNHFFNFESFDMD